MKQYIIYLWYILKHKYYVSIECFKEGLYWRGLVHDLSKFLPSEFIPYANFFYNKVRDNTGYYKPTDTGNKAFDLAWILHQKRNKHHWQWWIIPEDNNKIKVMCMESKYVTEMICDWVGAGKAQGFFSPKNDRYFETRKWYKANGDKMNLHHSTRVQIDLILEETNEIHR